MKKRIRTIGILGLGLLLFGLCSFLYLNRGLEAKILSAQLNCLPLEEGHFTNFDSLPKHIFGIGLAYAGHINETASEFNTSQDPPVFQKAVNSITQTASSVAIPTHNQLLQAIEEMELGLSKQIEADHPDLPALLDYEVELALVLLEDITAENLQQDDYAPPVGFFIANDLSARSIAILGEGQANRYDYWGISKSFSGFTPASQRVWIPSEFRANAIPCIQLQTIVNGELRQNQNTSDLIYTPLQMLQAIQRKYPDLALKKGDWVLTGTPGGVILSTPRWLVRLANGLNMDRLDKLNNKVSEASAAQFLKPGDRVITKGVGLGQVSVSIIAGEN